MPTDRPTGSTPDSSDVPGPTLTVFRLAAGFTFLAVALGAVVCATGSGAGCATWPGCRPDALTPAWQTAPVIEFTHRVVAIGAGPLVLAAALLALRLPGRDLWVRVLPWVALAGAAAAGAFGRLAVLSGIPTWQGAVDLTSALTAMTVMGIAAVRLGGVQPADADPGQPVTPEAGELVPVSRRHALQPVRLAGAAIVVLIAMQVAGLYTAGKGSFTRCMGWPLWQIVDGDQRPWLQVVRLVLAGVAAALVIGIVLLSVGHQRLRPWAAGLALLLGSELALGLVIGGGGSSHGLRASYSVIAVALLWGLGLFSAVARAELVAAAPSTPESVSV